MGGEENIRWFRGGNDDGRRRVTSGVLVNQYGPGLVGGQYQWRWSGIRLRDGHDDRGWGSGRYDDRRRFIVFFWQIYEYGTGGRCRGYDLRRRGRQRGEFGENGGGPTSGRRQEAGRGQGVQERSENGLRDRRERGPGGRGGGEQQEQGDRRQVLERGGRRRQGAQELDERGRFQGVEQSRGGRQRVDDGHERRGGQAVQRG